MDNTLVYTLKDFTNIIFNGFDFVLPEETIKLISELSLEVGSPSYVKTPIFEKRDPSLKKEGDGYDMNRGDNKCDTRGNYKKKRGNKNVENITGDDWETIRTFHTTKIEQKVGIDAQIDIIRSHLNKMTDKNFADSKNKIIELLDQINMESDNNDKMLIVGSNIFEIASTNRFYSKLYADLYSDLIQKYEPMKKVFENNFEKFMELFNNIDYVDSSLDYDKFCKINKDNEKRKSLSAFFVNLMINGIISKEKILSIVLNLLSQVYTFIFKENKKNEVDELTENITIMFKKELFEPADYENLFIEGFKIEEMIEKLANSKTKD